MSYGIRDFGTMVLDSARREAYLEVIRRYASGARVLDLGCGTGFFSLAALHHGAASVTSVDLMDSVRLLPSLITDNGYLGRSKVYQGDIRQMPEDRFDLILSDLRGPTPFYTDHFNVLGFALEHLLAQNGRITPTEDRMYAAVVNWPEKIAELSAPYDLDSHNWGPVLNTVLRTPFRVGTCPEDRAVGEPILFATVDYSTLGFSTQRHWGGEFEIVIPEDQHGHGLLVWFDTTVIDELSYSNSPACGRAPTYGRLFFPFDRAVDCLAGTTVQLTIRCHRIGHQWQWEWGLRNESTNRQHNTLDSMLIGNSLTVAVSQQNANEGFQRLL